MKQRIISLTKHPLVSGSSIVFIGTFISNILNYLFNLIMGRMLSVSEYGLLISMSSMIALFFIIQSSFSNIFAKYAASYNAKKDQVSLNKLYVAGFKITTLFSTGILIILLLFSYSIKSFLHIDNYFLVFITLVTVSISTMFAFPFGILQGELKFFMISLLNGINPIIKIILGVIFVTLGLKSFGAMSAIFVGYTIPLLVGIYYLFHGKVLHVNNEKHEEKLFYKEFNTYTIFFLLASLGITLISNGDVLLMRAFLNPTLAGQYAALSLMGKAIFYLTSPIYFVFFPLIASKKTKNEDTLGTLILAGALIGGVSLCISLFYFFLPHLVLFIFFPKPEYQMLSGYLGWFSLYICIFSLAFLLHNYFLSLGKTNIYKINLLVGLFFISSISLFHNSLYQVIEVLSVTSLLLFFSLLLYYFKNGRN